MKRFCTLVSVLVRLTLVTLTFLPNTFAQGAAPENMVRLVYFLPSDRPARPDRVAALRELIKDAQAFYAEQMESHGYGRKTFRIETDNRGTPVVHRVNGKFNENYYYTGLSDLKIWEELFEHFDDLEHVYFIVIDLNQEGLNDGGVCGLGGASFVPSGGITPGFLFRSPSGAVAIRHREITQKQEVIGGSLIIPASGDCFDRLSLTLHELGHAFGLEHDFREGIDSHYMMSFGRHANRLSACAAEWLSASRFFNSTPVSANSQGHIRLLVPPTYSPAGINLRFEVTDPDGLHQAQLIVPENLENGSWGAYRLFDCKRLNSKTSTVEFISPELVIEPVDRVTLQIMDVNGNITWATFLTDIAALLPPPKVVSIPDRNLAAAVREALGLSANAPITDQAMQRLTRLDARRSQIKNLTGLEHATRLVELALFHNQIQDVSPLAGLTQLQRLYIQDNQITDITPLAKLTQLRRLHLWDNQIRDIRPLAGLMQLTDLKLNGNLIQDTSPLRTLKAQNPKLEIDIEIPPLSPVVGPPSQDTLVEVPFANVPFDINNIPEPIPPPAAVRDFFQLDPYYQQWINVRGYPVLASAEVSPYAVKEIAWNIGHMIRHRPDILRKMAENKARFSIIPHNKHMSDIPEKDAGRLNFFYDTRQRGSGGIVTTSAEDNIICGDRNYCSGEVVHEFAHQIHDYGLGNWGIQGVDPTFDSRLKTLYNMAIAEGLYQHRYAGTNRWEYWAEGVGSWFDTPNEGSISPTRVALKAYDPRLMELIIEIFGDGDWRYTPPAARTHLPHLQGFNPEEAPIYQKPARLLELERQLRDPDSDGDGKWVNLKLHDPSELPRLLNSAARENRNRMRTDLIVANLTGTNIPVYFLDVDGRKNLAQRVDFNNTHFITEVGVIWLIQDHTGKDIAVVRAEEQVGRVLIGGPPSQDVLDVNSDGTVNLLDLTSIASRYGHRGVNPADINKDRIVNIADILWVAGSVSSLPQQAVQTFKAVEVQKWLTDAKQLRIEDEYQQKGIGVLEHLLTEIEVPSKSTAVATGPLQTVFEGHTKEVWSVAFSPDGRTLASGSWDRTIRLWNLRTRQLQTTLIGHTEDIMTVAFSPDGELLASAGWDQTIRLWNVRTGELIGMIKAHTDGIESVVFSPDGETLASASADQTIRLWNVKTRQLERTLTGMARIRSIAFSPNGEMLASGSGDNTIQLWNPKTGKHIRTLRGHTDWVNILMFSPNGKMVASSSSDRTIRLWNPDNGKHTRTLANQTGWRNPVVFSSDSARLLIGGRGLSIWNTQTGQYETPLAEDINDILSLVLSPDGQMVASGSKDGTVQLWDVQRLSEPEVLLAISKRPPMYWIDAEAGTLHRLVGDEVENLVPTVKNATSLAVDMAGGELYWTEKTGNTTGKIQRANLDGTNVQLVKKLTSVPHGIAIDTTNSKIYVTNGWGKIQRLNLDGSNFQSNLITDLQHPKHLVLDVARGKVYWAEQTDNRTGKIQRAHLDGSNVELVKELTSVPHGIAIDAVNRKLYLTNSWGKIQRLNVDGSNFQPNLITDLDAPQGVSVDTAGRKIYWTEQNSIRRADLNGKNIEDVVTSVGTPIGIVLGNGPAAAPAAPALVEHPPEATVILANYPNPFNPETWIPYQLSENADVAISIHATGGQLVRTLNLGHQAVGIYESRSRAAYWDGRNALGERVASGLYFYTLTAGDFTATRRMLILK